MLPHSALYATPDLCAQYPKVAGSTPAPPPSDNPGPCGRDFSCSRLPGPGVRRSRRVSSRRAIFGLARLLARTRHLCLAAMGWRNGMVSEPFGVLRSAAELRPGELAVSEAVSLLSLVRWLAASCELDALCLRGAGHYALLGARSSVHVERCDCFDLDGCSLRKRSHLDGGASGSPRVKSCFVGGVHLAEVVHVDEVHVALQEVARSESLVGEHGEQIVETLCRLLGYRTHHRYRARPLGDLTGEEQQPGPGGARRVGPEQPRKTGFRWPTHSPTSALRRRSHWRC